jgi:hypothetical protein
MISKKWSLCLATIGFVVTTGVSVPQTKKDFEKAAQETIGCGLIPYTQLYDSCRGAYSRQRDWCTGEREKGCADLPKDQKDEARKRRDNADECLKMRKEVRKTYSDTIDQLKGEKQDDIRPLAEEIIKRINATFPNHDVEIEKTERRRNTCNELL